MRMGTKSLLWGCHQFALHPLFTLWGWVRLYGWGSLNLQSLLAIIVHDWGYWSCPSMDGHRGASHPIRFWHHYGTVWYSEMCDLVWGHSRHLCQKLKMEPSLLCWADKLGTALMPSWLWALMAAASSEGYEYMTNANGNDYVPAEEPTIWGLRRFHLKYKREWGDPVAILNRARIIRRGLVNEIKSDKLDEWLRYK